MAEPVRVTVGATLAIATTIESTVAGPGSSSLAETDTVLEAGPSGKAQSKLLGAAVSVIVPLAPQLSTIVRVSSPGSLTVYV